MKEALTRKIGPLPTWAWVGIVLALVLAYVLWHNNQGQQQTSQNPADVTPPVIDQFTLTTPPAQEDSDEDDDKNTGPEKHHRHTKRPHSHPLHKTSGPPTVNKQPAGGGTKIHPVKGKRTPAPKKPRGKRERGLRAPVAA